MRYETKSVYLVKDKDSDVVHKIFGILSEAESYAKAIQGRVDEWPVEFTVSQQSEMLKVAKEGLGFEDIDLENPPEFRELLDFALRSKHALKTIEEMEKR